jgi:biopolymer transport protein ExbD
MLVLSDSWKPEGNPRMHPLRRRRKKPGINILPLLDVLMVILFFFLITMQFRQVRTLNLVLPEIQTAGSNLLSDKIILSVETDGSLLYNNTPVSESQFSAALKSAAGIGLNRQVLLLADEETPLRKVTWIMDQCRTNGLGKIRIQSR